MASKVWHDVIAVDNIDLSYIESVDAKRARHVSDVAMEVLSLSGGPFIDDGIDVDLLRYRYYDERPYVANHCVLPADLLESWRGRYIVHTDAVYWNRAILTAQCRYLDLCESMYWNTQG